MTPEIQKPGEASHQQGQRNHRQSPGSSPEPGIGDPLDHLPLREVDGLAEENGYHSTQSRQNSHLQQCHSIQIRRCHSKTGWRHPHQAGHPISHQRSGQARQKGGMIENTDADDHHGKHCGSQGGTEKSGKEGRHTHHGRSAHVPVIQAEYSAHMVTDGTAHLESCSLTAGGAAAQMGQDRTHKDGGQQQQGQPLPQTNHIDHIVGSLALGACKLIKAHDQEARQGQTPQKPGIRPPQHLCGVDTDMERRAHCTTDPAGDRRQGQPLHQRLKI